MPTVELPGKPEAQYSDDDLQETIIKQQEVIKGLQAKLDDCCPVEECPDPEPPAPPECDIEYLKHVYEQATCDREELERCKKELCKPWVQAKFCGQQPGGEQLWQDLKELADIEIAIACAHEAEAYRDWLCCVAQHEVQCRQKLCEGIVATAECIEKLDNQCIRYVQKLTGKCINW